MLAVDSMPRPSTSRGRLKAAVMGVAMRSTSVSCADAFEQDRELVAAETRHGVGRPGRLDQSLRGGLQQTVAGVVPQRVVDVLEVVQVEEHDRDALLRPLRKGQGVLDAVPEQAAVRQQRERVVEGQLAQLLLQRLALADVAEIQCKPGDGRIFVQVAAHALERAASVAGLEYQFDRADHAATSRRHLVQEGSKPFAVPVDPAVEQAHAGKVVRIDGERAFGGGRGEMQAAVHVGDHDDVGGVLDQRCIAGLDQPGGALFAEQRVIAREYALAHHHQRREEEDDHGHHVDRARGGAAFDVNQHAERHHHGDVGDAIDQRDAQGAWRPLDSPFATQLLARRGCQPDVAREVDDVGDATRDVAAVHLRHGPDDVGDGHRREAERQEHQRAPPDRGGAGVHQENAARKQHEAIEGDVGLRQAVLEQVGIALGFGGGGDHQEPEKRAEAQHQDRGVEPEPQPLHADRRRPKYRQDGREDERVERDEEQVADRRERIDAVEPEGGVQSVAHAVRDHRRREQRPGASRGWVGRALWLRPRSVLPR